jgi:hypothetical protein
MSSKQHGPKVRHGPIEPLVERHVRHPAIESWPRSSSRSHKWEPKNPAPPVTSIRFTELLASVLTWRRLLAAAVRRFPIDHAHGARRQLPAIDG